MPSLQIFADNIFYFREVIKDSNLLLDAIDKTDSILSDFDAITAWYDWKSSSDSYIFGQKKDINLLKISTSSQDVTYIVKEIMSAISYVESIYTETTGIDIGAYSPPCISKYFSGKMMGPHVDGDASSKNNPVMSAVIYINDNYTGGEIEFPNQNIKIKPEAGSVVMFPSVEPFVHDPKEVLTGEKIMCPVFWKKL